MELVFLGFTWILYFFIHSFLATFRVKLYVKKRFTSLFAYYRICYNGIAILGLIPLLYLSVFLPDTYLLSVNWLGPIGYILIATGLVLLYLAFKAFDGAEFLGIKKEKMPELVLSGMYRYVRHPILPQSS